MFWSLEDESTGTITLCDEHALEATNMGLLDHAESRNREADMFESMEEATAVLGALMASIGHDLGITSSESGECGECEFERRGVA